VISSNSFLINASILLFQAIEIYSFRYPRNTHYSWMVSWKCDYDFSEHNHLSGLLLSEYSDIKDNILDSNIRFLRINIETLHRLSDIFVTFSFAYHGALDELHFQCSLRLSLHNKSSQFVNHAGFKATKYKSLQKLVVTSKQVETYPFHPLYQASSVKVNYLVMCISKNL
jgi:hypothetical protein